MNSIISLPRRTKTYRFLIASVDGRKRFEDASVDADICIRFRSIKNAGIRKRISVDVALVNQQMNALVYMDLPPNLGIRTRAQ